MGEPYFYLWIYLIFLLSVLCAVQEPVLLLNIRSAAHVVKGAAANLMCEPLRLAAYDLEIVAKNAPPDEPLTYELKLNLHAAFERLKNAGSHLNKYVEGLEP